jgi:hypothetical protein
VVDRSRLVSSLVIVGCAFVVSACSDDGGDTGGTTAGSTATTATSATTSAEGTTSDGGTDVTGGTGGAPCQPDPGTAPEACELPAAVIFSDIAGSQIWTMDLDGSNATVLMDQHADDVAVDRDGDALWWVTGDTTLMRSSMDGTGAEVVLDGLPSIYGLTLDIPTHTVYWANQVGEPKIQRACMDGSGIEEVLPGGECCMIGIDLDPVTRTLYWMDGYYGGPVSRMALGETTPEVIGTTVGIANGIDVDAGNGKVYWTEYGNGPDDDVVRRADLDGGNLETLLTAADGLQTPQHIAVDPVGGKLYLADIHAEQIVRANLDGSGVETLWSQAGALPRGIALDRREPCQ